MQAVPRVNGRLLPQYINRQVCLVGRVLQSNEYSTVIEASDRQQVQIYSRAGGVPLPQQSIVEFIGHVNEDSSVTEISRTAFSDNFNVENYEEFIKLTQRPDLAMLFGK